MTGRSHSPGPRRLRRRLLDLELHRLSGNGSNPAGVPDEIPAGTTFFWHERSQRDDLLLQGGRRQQRQRQGREVERGERDPGRRGRTDGAQCAARRLQPANETLSDAGRWTNAIIGGEGGFNVSSNELACWSSPRVPPGATTRSTGDTEVWAGLSTLPGLNDQLASMRDCGCRDHRVRPAHEPDERGRRGLARALQRRPHPPPDDPVAARCRRHHAPAGKGLGDRGLAHALRRVLVAPRRGTGLDLPYGRLGRRPDCAAPPAGWMTSERGRSEHRARPARRLPWRHAQVTARSHSPGLRRAPTAARRSRVTPCYRGTAPNPTGVLTTTTVRRQRTHVTPTPKNGNALLQSRGCQRERRRREVERGKRDADRSCRSHDPVDSGRRLQPPQRDALRRGSLDERDHRRRERLRRQFEPAGLFGHHHLHCAAQQRPVRSRRRGLGANDDPSRLEQPASPVCPPPVHDRVRAAHEPDERGRRQVWLERFNGGLTRLLTIPSQLAAGDTMLLPGQGLDDRGLAPAFRRFVVARRLRAGLDLLGGRLRRSRTARDDGPTRRLRSADTRRRCRPTPRLPPTRRTCRQVRSARPRSTSPGRPPRTRAASTCTGSSAAPARAAPTSPRSRPCRATRRPSPTRP